MSKTEIVGNEPQGAEGELDLADGLLASSHRFAHSAMVLEAGLYTRQRQPLPALRPFACAVNEMLGCLAETLHESHQSTRDLPELREAQRRFMQSTEREYGSSAFVSQVTRETERVTNSLNTMAELVRKQSNTVRVGSTGRGGSGRMTTAPVPDAYRRE
jgi:hypothetical protein